MPAPAYDVLLVCHVLSALLGFGSIAISSLAARRGRLAVDPSGDERISRFFKQGTDWPGRLIFLVPVLGLTMLLGGDHSDIPKVWPWLGLALWAVAVGVVTSTGWPAERAAQQALAAVRSGEPGRLAEFRQACRRMESASAVVSICFVIALTLMIWQPGS